MKHGCRILTILASDGPIAFDDKDIRLKALSEQESNESYRQTMTTMGFGKKATGEIRERMERKAECTVNSSC